MTMERRSTSFFDDIFQLQTTVPDIDPEDPEDGFKSGLTHGASEVEVFESSKLRKQAAIIPDDPKYRGKKISRKALHSDDEEFQEDSSEEGDGSNISGNESVEDGEDEEMDDDDSDIDEDGKEDDDSLEDGDDEDVDEEETLKDSRNKKDPLVLAPSDTSDREKGRIVSHQVDLWDDIIKCRISLQKIVSACNRLPAPYVWKNFASFSSFQKESASAHKSVNKVLSLLLDLQQQLMDKLPNQKHGKKDDMDEEITSESELEDEEGDRKSMDKKEKDAGEDDKSDGIDEEENDDVGDDDNNDEGSVEEEEMDDDDGGEDAESHSDSSIDEEEKVGGKRKLSGLAIKGMLTKRHKEFRAFRNATLEKWDEKTRLSHAKIKAKNFAAFDISVLQQIQQVLGNKDRLIRRIHQNRSSVRTLGKVVADDPKKSEEAVVEDDDDEVEMKPKSVHTELDVNYEIVDDSDFYQICLRDFIQLKQNEETDPVLANKYWLEIQNMRKKQKRKVDTRASKGRKIRYHVKEKLKNFMAPYDKSMWSDEQRDDLFKALFGGKQDGVGGKQDGVGGKQEGVGGKQEGVGGKQEGVGGKQEGAGRGDGVEAESVEAPPTINIGL